MRGPVSSHDHLRISPIVNDRLIGYFEEFSDFLLNDMLFQIRHKLY